MPNPSQRHIEKARELDLAMVCHGAGGRVALIATALASAEADLVKRMMEPRTEPPEQFFAYQNAVNAGATVLNQYVGKDPAESYGGTYEWASECVEAFLTAFCKENNIEFPDAAVSVRGSENG